MLVFDGSASMAEISLEVSSPRILEARAALRRVLPQVEAVRRFGLVTYGPGAEASCDGIDLIFPPRENAAGPAIEAVETFAPAGLTALTDAVRLAAETLNYRAEPGIIVLVTDGNETCGGRPCTLGEHLAAVGTDLTVHVIGFRATRDFFTWNNPDAGAVPNDSVARCLADKTGGQFVTAETEDALVAALWEVMGCAVIGAVRPARGKAEGAAPLPGLPPARQWRG